MNPKNFPGRKKARRVSALNRLTATEYTGTDKNYLARIQKEIDILKERTR